MVFIHITYTPGCHTQKFIIDTDKDTNFVKLWPSYHTKYIQMTSPYIKTCCCEECIF